jgi:hypothetical protein
MTRSLALSVAPEGILVNAIGVGAVATDNWAQNMLPNVRHRRPELAGKNEEVMALLGKEKTPVGRFGLPEDIAAIRLSCFQNEISLLPDRQLKRPAEQTDLCDSFRSLKSEVLRLVEPRRKTGAVRQVRAKRLKRIAGGVNQRSNS